MLVYNLVSKSFLALIISFLLFGCKEELSFNPSLDYDCTDTTLSYFSDGRSDFSLIQFTKNNSVIRSIYLYGDIEYTYYTNYDNKGRITKQGNIYNGIESFTEYVYGIYDTIREMRNSDGNWNTYKYNKYRKLIETKGYLYDELIYEDHRFYKSFDNAEVTTIISTETQNTHRIKLYNSTIIPVSTDTMSHFSIYYYSNEFIDSALFINNNILVSKYIYRYDSKKRNIYNEYYGFEYYFQTAYKNIYECSYSNTDKLNWEKRSYFRKVQGEYFNLVSLIEMEYLYDTNDNLYRMECNRFNSDDPFTYYYYILVNTEGRYKYYRYYTQENNLYYYTKYSPSCINDSYALSYSNNKNLNSLNYNENLRGLRDNSNNFSKEFEEDFQFYLK
jgi:hypothetical protein